MSMASRIRKAVQYLVTLEVCSGHSFLPELVGPDTIVLDLGANHGMFSREMTKRFGCRCHAVEPNPTLVAMIQQNETFPIFGVAASGTRDKVVFQIMESDQASGIHRFPGMALLDQVEVEAYPYAEIVKHFGLERVDLLKIDIEGSEIALLDAMSDDEIKAISQITIEFHDTIGIGTAADTQRMLDRLRKLGFVDIWPYPERSLDVLFVNRARHPWVWRRKLRFKIAGRPLLKIYWVLDGVFRDAGFLN